ncbi:CRISPR-associated endonuclease Cas2 [Candidatus Kaiserbacteria bacterium]|nr:CRISPR-associated endonuclease Cas2 [Candidatus Kaiserbacteria bacterium]
MGEIERGVRARVRRSKINNAIIGALAVSGGLAVALVAPNVLGVLGRVINAQRRQSLQRSFSKLIQHGYVVLEQGPHGKRARLTAKGDKFAALLGEGKLRPKQPKNWDKKWRLLIFDIPERRRKDRDQIRATLVSIGFYRLQDSVWVYPYDCEDLITLLKVDYRIGKNLLYVVADAIEHDVVLRSHFGL